ncbi:hypothetical protein HOI04_03450 [archaeon]|jgi:ribosome-binding protein aMBF1 (putative translation factor)|nr:hypothetical protein [archaeon]
MFKNIYIKTQYNLKITLFSKKNGIKYQNEVLEPVFLLRGNFFFQKRKSLMRCKFCKKESEETQLFEGIFEHEMIRVCSPCAEIENVPIMRKPSIEQLDRAQTTYTVRERMEKMSGMNDPEKKRKNDLHMQGDLAKLKMPPKKQYHEDLLDNYSWSLNLARRRMKMSIKQLSEEVEVSEYILQEIEKGQLPNDFEEIFLKLEHFLKIKLLKNHKPVITFAQKKDDEQEILKRVQERMENVGSGDDLEELGHLKKLKEERLAKLAEEKGKFSKEQNQKDLENITLSDLVELKKKKEQKENDHKQRIQTDAMIGDDIEIDEL